MILPSGLKLALSRDALFDHGGNWTKCPEEHFWFWAPAPELGPPPFDLLADVEIMQIAEHAPAPKNREEVKAFIRVLEMRTDEKLGWRGEWLSTFPRYTNLSTEDIAAWNKWIESPETKTFLDEALAECTRLANLSHKAQGYVLLHPTREAALAWAGLAETPRRDPSVAPSSKAKKLLGDHPRKGGPVTLMYGVAGWFVSSNGVAAVLPGGMTPESITLCSAVELLDATERRWRDRRRKAE